MLKLNKMCWVKSTFLIQLLEVYIFLMAHWLLWEQGLSPLPPGFAFNYVQCNAAPCHSYILLLQYMYSHLERLKRLIFFFVAGTVLDNTVNWL